MSKQRWRVFGVLSLRIHVDADSKEEAEKLLRTKVDFAAEGMSADLRLLDAQLKSSGQVKERNHGH